MYRLLQNKLFLWFSFILYCPSFIYIVFFLRRRRGIHIRSLYLVPLKNKIDFLATYASRMNFNDWKSWLSDPLGNIVLFIPFSFFMFFLANKKNPATIIISAAITSILIESIQYMMEIGVADIDDVIFNTTGAAIGLYLLKKIKPQAAFF